MDMVQTITTALAVLGAVLGVMNAWRNWVHDRVAVRVILGNVLSTDGAWYVAVTVRNLSRFPVTITSASICLPDKRHTPVVFFPGCVMQPSEIPIRLESRTTFTVLIPAAAVPEEYRDPFCFARAGTACGLTFRSRWKWKWVFLFPFAV